MRSWVGQPLFEAVVALGIVVSLLLLIPEVSLPTRNPWLPLVERCQDILTVFFGWELLLRYRASPRKSRFWNEYWSDVLAVFPLLRVARFFRLLRLLRLLRLASVAGQSGWLQRSLAGRGPEYVLGAFCLLFCVTLGTLGLTHFEHPNAGLSELYSNFWISVFTITQAEYAAQLPNSLGGKLVLLLLEVSGLSLFALLAATSSAFLIEKLRNGRVLSPMQLEELDNHVLICGWNSGLEATLAQLQNHPDFRSRHFVVVADRKELPELPDLPAPQRVRLVRDDFTRIEVLQKCRVDRAAVALIVSDVAQGRTRQDADARTVLAALTIEKLNPSVYTCAELSNAMNESHLRMGQVNEVIITQDLSGHLLAQAAASPSCWRTLQELVHPQPDRPGFTAFPVSADLVGLSFGDLVQLWMKERGILVVGVFNQAGQTLLNPQRYVIEEGDQLVGILPGK